MGDRLAIHQAAIVALAGSVHAVDVRAYESAPPAQIVAGLHPQITQLLEHAESLVAEVIATCDHVQGGPEARDQGLLGSPYLPFEQAIDAAVGVSSALVYRAVADIAFLGRLELRQRRERLARVAACDSAITIVGECDGALRRILKVLTALDRTLAQAGLVEARLDYATELELSLRVRKACAKFRARIQVNGEPEAHNLHAHLRSAGTTIAMLVGWDAYPQLRVRDRLQLRELQRRLLDWLRGERDATEGLRLWQDLMGFVRMLGQVSRRQELVAHDALVVREARAKVELGGGTPVPDALLADLMTLEGLDEEVDALLKSDDRSKAACWVPPLERLALHLKVESGA
jgi:hypothetical protein